MTDAELRILKDGRMGMLREALASARSDASSVLFEFTRLCDEAEPDSAALADVAHELVLKVGRIAGFATLLARDEGKKPCP